jgi:hypothetical protein
MMRALKVLITRTLKFHSLHRETKVPVLLAALPHSCHRTAPRHLSTVRMPRSFCPTCLVRTLHTASMRTVHPLYNKCPQNSIPRCFQRRAVVQPRIQLLFSHNNPHSMLQHMYLVLMHLLLSLSLFRNLQTMHGQAQLSRSLKLQHSQDRLRTC